MSRKQTVLHFLLTAAAGALTGLFTLHMGEHFAVLRLPILFPPVWILPAGWAAVLMLAACSFRHIHTALSHNIGQDAEPQPSPAFLRESRTSFYVSLGLIFIWAVLFFRVDAKFFATVTGLLLTGVWLRAYRLLKPIMPRAAKMLLPCVIWAGYLSYCNIGICILN